MLLAHDDGDGDDDGQQRDNDDDIDSVAIDEPAPLHASALKWQANHGSNNKKKLKQVGRK